MPRLEVAVVGRDGSAQVVNAGRPATLVAFGDEYENRQMPETMREVAWVVHHALGIEEPLDDWIRGLESISALPDDLALARLILAGDEEAKRVALGESEQDVETYLAARSNGSDPTERDPGVAQAEEALEQPTALTPGGG